MELAVVCGGRVGACTPGSRQDMLQLAFWRHMLLPSLKSNLHGSGVGTCTIRAGTGLVKAPCRSCSRPFFVFVDAGGSLVLGACFTTTTISTDAYQYRRKID